MNEALVQPLSAAPVKQEADNFEAVYERTFPRVYAYVAWLDADPGVRAGLECRA